MPKCKHCGKVGIEGHVFCPNCGVRIVAPRSMPSKETRLDKSAYLPKKSGAGKLVIFSGAGIVLLGLLIFFVLNNINKEKEQAGTPNQPDSQQVIYEQEPDPARRTLQDVQIEKEIGSVDLNNKLHLGMSREEVIGKYGQPVRVIEHNQDVVLEYEDAIYTAERSNGLIYAVEILPVHTEGYSFERIRTALGDGDEHLSVEQGKDAYGLYYLSYGTEDYAVVFYSSSKAGETVTKITYSSASILSTDDGEEEAGKEPNKEPSKAVIEEPPSDLGPILNAISTEYKAINKGISTLKRQDTTTAEGFKRKVYTNAKGINKKIIERTPQDFVEYYYDDAGKVLFIFFYKGRTGHRFYFYQDQLIQWTNPKHINIQYKQGQANPEFKNWEKQWIERAY